MQTKCIPLSRLLSLGRVAYTPVAVSNDRVFLWKDFVEDVTVLSTIIRKIGIGRWLLYSEDTYRFTVGLFALWHADSVAVLPPNFRQQTLDEMNNDLAGVVTDSKINLKNVPSISPIVSPLNSTFPVWEALKKDVIQLEIFTSGSTGTRKAIKKTLANLESEVEEQEAVWGEKLGNSTIFSTVSHQHIYGLLFKVLWPLHAGRVFWNEILFSPNDLVAKLKTVDIACLVSGPAHLNRMPELIDLSELGRNCRVIFSSGGPLNAGTSLIFAQSAQLTPYEILGSTETGGIAWRQQSPETVVEDTWKPFRKVEVEVELPDCFLKVRSPFFNEVENEGWLLTGDVAEMAPDKTFVLKGRGDRVVKIEEKRLSLPDMEKRLESHQWVDTAKIFLKEDPPYKRHRTPLTTLIVLSESGKINFDQKQIRETIGELKQLLSKSFDPVLLPRYWKFVDQLPEDALGKTTLSDLRDVMTKQKGKK